MITYHSEPGSPVVEISVEGRVTNAELKDAMERFKADIEVGGKTRVLEIIEHFTGVEPAALWTDITMGMPLANKITRAAVVADPRWVRAITGLGMLFTKAEVKAFEPSELAEARVWVAQ